MPIWRLQTAIAGDSLLPRDFMTITPHFNDQGVGTDPDQLCTDLAAAISTWMDPPNGREIMVRAYDAQGTAPVFPQGEARINVGQSPGSLAPRELALCLSFYSERNSGRSRGRLYVPFTLLGSTAVGVRPTSAHRTKIAALVPLLTGLGGTDVDWCVWSRRDNQAKPVTNWWVDDEWDIQRRRGLRPTARTIGTASE